MPGIYKVPRSTAPVPPAAPEVVDVVDPLVPGALLPEFVRLPLAKLTN